MYHSIVSIIGPGFYIPEHLRDALDLRGLFEDIKKCTSVENQRTVAKVYLRKMGISKRWIVSAAIYLPDFYSVGNHFFLATPRHFTSHTHTFIRNLCTFSPEFAERYKEYRKVNGLKNKQGFIDQYGEFLSRTEAKACIEFTGQEHKTPLDDELYSEDIYGFQKY